MKQDNRMSITVIVLGPYLDLLNLPKPLIEPSVHLSGRQLTQCIMSLRGYCWYCDM